MGGIGTKAIIDINQTANRFESSIVLRMNDKNLDANSILGLSMTLLSATSYKLEIHGTDEAEAKAAMVEMFNKHNLILERLKGLKERSKRC
ncbi:HPr family phosphocarrier protein [Ammoniphilus sp. 3BR4]|uniref:HPr family phosphocarrier protein n=1 Tax=Ammoniphilus sp. 3BR4 TaxID=3158265 RepID=UPI003465F4CC